jgi:hypothetical protein
LLRRSGLLTGAKTIYGKLTGGIRDCPAERSTGRDSGRDAEKIPGIASTRALG